MASIYHWGSVHRNTNLSQIHFPKVKPPYIATPKAMYSSTTFYRPQRSCGKVMFPQASVILSRGGVSQHTVGQTPPPNGHCSGRYASVDSKECLWACTYGFKRFSGLQSSLGITNGNRSHNKPLELIVTI